jgi:hypothetical protein
MTAAGDRHATVPDDAGEWQGRHGLAVACYGRSVAR